jgi:hypothetical protein
MNLARTYRDIINFCEGDLKTILAAYLRGGTTRHQDHPARQVLQRQPREIQEDSFLRQPQRGIPPVPRAMDGPKEILTPFTKAGHRHSDEVRQL